MASNDLNELLRILEPFAEQMLREYGEFHPFGGLISTKGEARQVGAKGKTEFPPAQELIDLLVNAFYEKAKNGEIRACGICLDTRFRPSQDAIKTDAICFRLESRLGEAIAVYRPYKTLQLPSGNGFDLEFGELVTTFRAAEVFIVQQS